MKSGLENNNVKEGEKKKVNHKQRPCTTQKLYNLTQHRSKVRCMSIYSAPNVEDYLIDKKLNLKNGRVSSVLDVNTSINSSVLDNYQDYIDLTRNNIPDIH